MRLSPYEQQAISTIMHKHFGENATVLLFGSRVDDSKKGGDIDLYVAPKNMSAEQAGEAKSKAIVEIWEAIGEQKIDVVLRLTPDFQLPIYDVALREGVPL